MRFALILLETEGGHELPFPSWVFGLVAFALLVVLLLITLAIGKGRAHS
ncbi:MAG: hypothetical protein H0T91_12790 [Propionibacteriaceae bacterium]|nr:hypothetical protein [Propionibacteriaceae bacterium]